MLFHKSIVSFVAAITLATIVTAAATPPLTGTGSPNKSPSQGSSQGPSQNSGQGSSKAPTCSTGPIPMCCEASIPFVNLSDSVRASLQTLEPSLNQNLNVGQNCTPSDSQGCGNLLPLCCDAVQSADDLPDLAPSCVSPMNSA